MASSTASGGTIQSHLTATPTKTPSFRTHPADDGTLPLGTMEEPFFFPDDTIGFVAAPDYPPRMLWTKLTSGESIGWGFFRWRDSSGILVGLRISSRKRSTVGEDIWIRGGVSRGSFPWFYLTTDSQSVLVVFRAHAF